jgi:hypothetical protein
MILYNSLLPKKTNISNQNSFSQAKAAITPFIKAKAAQANETLFQTKNQWTTKELIDKRLRTYAKDCNTQRLSWINSKENNPLASDQVAEMDLLKQIQLTVNKQSNTRQQTKALSQKK